MLNKILGDNRYETVPMFFDIHFTPAEKEEEKEFDSPTVCIKSTHDPGSAGVFSADLINILCFFSSPSFPL